MRTTEILVSLVGSSLFGLPVGDGVIEALSERGAMDELFRLAKVHDLTHLIFTPLTLCGAVEEGSAEYGWLLKAEELAFYRHRRMIYAVKTVSEVLSGAGVDFVLLKGAVINKLYPTNWHRTSGDIDVLVREEQLDGAVRALCDRAGYTTDGKRDYHDVSLYSSEGVHLELHFSLKENDPRTDGVLSRAWEYASPVKEGGCEHSFTNEFFTFHLVAHAAYHFVYGGCGVKPFSDLYVWLNANPCDENALNSLLSECGLNRFFECMRSTALAWFSNGEYTDVVRQIEAHVIANEICNDTNRAYAVRRARNGGIGYILSRAFPPLSEMSIRYPALKKHPYLLPIFWLVRQVSLIFNKGDRKRVGREISQAKDRSLSSEEALTAFYSYLGLQ